jgi:hypothetical protein
MPFDYEIDAERRKVLVRVSGAISDQELLAEVDRMLSDPLFPQAARMLWDARDRVVALSPATVEPLIHLLNRHQSALRGARCALVTSRPAVFGMQRLFSLRSESRVPLELQAFRDLSEAIAWLEGSGVAGAPAPAERS